VTRLVSIETKIRQICGLTDKDVNDWERRFIDSMQSYLPPGGQTTALSENQIAVIERIWEEHFA
jgi:hypothetical protein